MRKIKYFTFFLFVYFFLFFNVNAQSSYHVNLSYNEDSLNNIKTFLHTFVGTLESNSTDYVILDNIYSSSTTGNCFITSTNGFSSCSITLLSADALTIKSRNRSGYSSGLLFSGTNLKYYNLQLFKDDLTNVIYLSDKTTVLNQSVFPTSWTSTGNLTSAYQLGSSFAFTSWTNFPLYYNMPSVYSTNVRFINIYDNYDFDININDKLFIGDDNKIFPCFVNDFVEPLPEYLQGYDKIDFSSLYQFLFISNKSSGYIYVSREDYEKYKPVLNYYNLELESQPFTSIIPLWIGTIDGKYYKIKFDLSTYEGADLISFSKFNNTYTGPKNTTAYFVYVPTGSYVSFSSPMALGDGNVIDFDYIDPDGNLQSGSVENGDITNLDYGLSYALEELNKKLGFLTYPFELTIDVVNRYKNLTSSNSYVIAIPQIHDPIYNITIIHSQSFDFNSILDNPTFNAFYQIYLIVVDTIIIVLLVNLIGKKYDEIFGGAN